MGGMQLVYIHVYKYLNNVNLGKQFPSQTQEGG
jgi:hypothetical protein